MNKCQRCKNEGLKEDYKYCPICGLEIGTAQEVPVQEQLGSGVSMYEMKNNLLQGNTTINQIRSVFGLKAIKDANKYITKV